MFQVASLAHKSSDNLVIAPTSLNADASLHGQIISALKTVYDPEIPVNTWTWDSSMTLIATSRTTSISA
jgi:hypothetical protein